MQPIAWREDALYALDQTLLPIQEKWVRLDTVEKIADAICRLVVRGAPLIGVSAAYGIAISARNQSAEGFLSGIRADAARLRGTRPTAVNLFWAIERCMQTVESIFAVQGLDAAQQGALQLAQEMEAEDVRLNMRLGAYGASLLQDGDHVLTHCNAGALATAGFGTALGVIRAAVAEGKRLHVYADETRPLLQGARLTAWELHRDGIPVTLLCDNMAATLLRDGKVQRVIVGADRIAANGDTANKIGTYALAVLCAAHGVPFTVAAPCSTIDLTMTTGQRIPIEHRAAEEVGNFFGVCTAPKGIDFYNPAFDVTPARLIDSIVTEYGILRAPFAQRIQEIASKH
ncbi:MAG: S-methyl-5-thioribose-1-phosphate isomerase [Clostridia bacterium]